MSKGPAGAALRFTQAQSLFGAALLTVLALLNTPFTTLLRSDFARLTGELSYCLYLVHVAIGDAYVNLMSLFDVHLEASLGPFPAVLLRAFFIVIVSYGIALLSRKYLERPFLRMKTVFQ